MAYSNVGNGSGDILGADDKYIGNRRPKKFVRTYTRMFRHQFTQTKVVKDRIGLNGRTPNDLNHCLSVVVLRDLFCHLNGKRSYKIRVRYVSCHVAFVCLRYLLLWQLILKRLYRHKRRRICYFMLWLIMIALFLVTM